MKELFVVGQFHRW